MNVLGNNLQIHNQFMAPALAAIPSPRYNVSTGLAAACGNFVDSHVPTQRGIGGPHQTKLFTISTLVAGYRWSVMYKQVTSTHPPIPGNEGVLVTCIYITDHL